MHILILGGTRFTGRALATRLIKYDQDVTVSSRRPDMAPVGAHVYGGERVEALRCLSIQNCFDLVIDFTAYDAESVRQALEAFPDTKYLLISSIWVTKIAERIAADAAIPAKVVVPLNMPDLTRRYIVQKADAENQVLQARKNGRIAATLRLPIIWGEHDHTGRLDFYRQRILDGNPLILVNGGKNMAQIAWNEDVAEAISRYVISSSLAIHPCLDALPDYGHSVISIISAISSAEGLDFSSISVSEKKLSQEIPEYLLTEPLWREKSIAPGGGNIFKITGYNHNLINDWLAEIIKKTKPNAYEDNLRSREIYFLKAHGHT
jgi:hypothetical protein